MPILYRKIAVLAGGLLLAGCAAAQQSYGNQPALSPDERELQSLQHQMSVVNRRLDAIASAQQNSQIEDDVRTLRGQLEDLKHEVKQNQEQVNSALRNISARLQQLEPGGATSPASPSSVASPARGSANESVPGIPASSSGSNETQMPTSAGSTGRVLPSSKTGPAALQQSSAKSRGLTREVAYIHAFNLLQAGKLNQAVSGFQAFLKQYPSGEYSDNALYWLGSAYYVEDDSKDALSTLDLLITKFPNSPKVPDAMVKVGIIYQDKHKPKMADAEFNRVLKKYPNSNAASIAKQRLGTTKN